MSYWQRDHVRPRARRSLPARVDVVVIGGGFAGLTTAIRARERGAAVAVLEAEHVGFGASGRNAGFVSPLPAPIWMLGAARSTEQRWAAAQLDREVAATTRWLATLGDTELAPATLALRGGSRLWDGSIDELAAATAVVGLPHRLRASLIDPRRRVLELPAHTMHPVKLIHALADRAEHLGVAICERARVTAIEGSTVRVGGAALAADTVVVCTNGYTAGLALGERLRALTVHAFLAASAPLPHPAPRDGDLTIEVHGLYQPYHRLHGRRLVFGGVDTVLAPRRDEPVRRALSTAMAAHVPGATLAELWSGAFHATPTGLPILRRSAVNPAVVLNLGYGGTGVALSLACAGLAAGLATASLAEPDARLLAAIADTRVPIRDGLAALAAIGAGLVARR